GTTSFLVNSAKFIEFTAAKPADSGSNRQDIGRVLDFALEFTLNRWINHRPRVTTINFYRAPVTLDHEKLAHSRSDDFSRANSLTESTLQHFQLCPIVTSVAGRCFPIREHIAMNESAPKLRALQSRSLEYGCAQSRAPEVCASQISIAEITRFQ